jgi:AraC-like DNA-binding protein
MSHDRTAESSDASSAPPPGFFRFSTADYSPRERVDAWREVFGRTVLNVDIEPMRPDSFHAEATAYRSNGLGLLFATTAPARQGNSRALIASDDLSFGVGPDCDWSIAQRGRAPAVRPGDGVLLSNGEPGTISFSRTCSYMAFCVPAAPMRALIADLDAALVRPVPAGSPALRLLTGYLGVARDTALLSDPQAQHMIATHVYDLLALALGATRDATDVAQGRGLRAGRLAAIKADVLKALQFDVSVKAVAAAHRISERYLQRLFEEDGTTFSAFVLEARLALAYRLLIDPAQAGRSISALAVEAGFGDVSYFNRRFRSRYGCTPSDARAAAL